MIRKTYMLILIILISIKAYSFDVLQDDETRVIFYSVGQGNCTLIETTDVKRTSEEDKKIIKYITLIDAGSSQSPPQFKKLDIKQFVEKVAHEVGSHFQGADEKHIKVILSHPDLDHINLMEKVLVKISAEHDSSIEFFMGGDENIWEETKTARKLKEYIKNHPRSFTFASSSERPTTRLTIGDSKINFLFFRCEEALDSNSSSLVVMYEFGNIVALIPGDATAKTEEHMRKAGVLKKPEGKKLIALASHHGAKIDCNTPGWVEAFQPDYAVISTSGSHAGFEHPSEIIVSRYSKYSEDDPSTNTNHTLTCYIDAFNQVEASVSEINPHVKKAIEETLRSHESQGALEFSTLSPLQQFILRVELSTKKAIYSTADSGDISFTWNFTQNDHPKVELRKVA